MKIHSMKKGGQNDNDRYRSVIQGKISGEEKFSQ